MQDRMEKKMDQWHERHVLLGSQIGLVALDLVDGEKYGSFCKSTIVEFVSCGTIEISKKEVG